MNTNLVIFQHFRKYTCKVLHVHVSIDDYPFFIYRDSDFMNTSSVCCTSGWQCDRWLNEKKKRQWLHIFLHTILFVVGTENISILQIEIKHDQSRLFSRVIFISKCNFSQNIGPNQIIIGKKGAIRLISLYETVMGNICRWFALL